MSYLRNHTTIIPRIHAVIAFFLVFALVMPMVPVFAYDAPGDNEPGTGSPADNTSGPDNSNNDDAYGGGDTKGNAAGENAANAAAADAADAAAEAEAEVSVEAATGVGITGVDSKATSKGHKDGSLNKGDVVAVDEFGRSRTISGSAVADAQKALDNAEARTNAAMAHTDDESGITGASKTGANNRSPVGSLSPTTLSSLLSSVPLAEQKTALTGPKAGPKAGQKTLSAKTYAELTNPAVTKADTFSTNKGVTPKNSFAPATSITGISSNSQGFTVTGLDGKQRAATPAETAAIQGLPTSENLRTQSTAATRAQNAIADNKLAALNDEIVAERAAISKAKGQGYQAVNNAITKADNKTLTDEYSKAVTKSFEEGKKAAADARVIALMTAATEKYGSVVVAKTKNKPAITEVAVVETTLAKLAETFKNIQKVAETYNKMLDETAQRKAEMEKAKNTVVNKALAKVGKSTIFYGMAVNAYNKAVDAQRAFAKNAGFPGWGVTTTGIAIAVVSEKEMAKAQEEAAAAAATGVQIEIVVSTREESAKTYAKFGIQIPGFHATAAEKQARADAVKAGQTKEQAELSEKIGSYQKADRVNTQENATRVAPVDNSAQRTAPTDNGAESTQPADNNAKSVQPTDNGAQRTAPTDNGAESTQPADNNPEKAPVANQQPDTYTGTDPGQKGQNDRGKVVDDSTPLSKPGNVRDDRTMLEKLAAFLLTTDAQSQPDAVPEKPDSNSDAKPAKAEKQPETQSDSSKITPSKSHPSIFNFTLSERAENLEAIYEDMRRNSEITKQEVETARVRAETAKKAYEQSRKPANAAKPEESTTPTSEQKPSQTVAVAIEFTGIAKELKKALEEAEKEIQEAAKKTQEKADKLAKLVEEIEKPAETKAKPGIAGAIAQKLKAVINPLKKAGDKIGSMLPGGSKKSNTPSNTPAAKQQPAESQQPSASKPTPQQQNDEKADKIVGEIVKGVTGIDPVKAKEFFEKLAGKVKNGEKMTPEETLKELAKTKPGVTKALEALKNVAEAQKKGTKKEKEETFEKAFRAVIEAIPAIRMLDKIQNTVQKGAGKTRQSPASTPSATTPKSSGSTGAADASASKATTPPSKAIATGKPSSPAQAAADAIAAAIEAGLTAVDVKATSEAHKNGAKAGTVITDSSDEFGTCCTLTAEDVAKIATETAAKGETENADAAGKPVAVYAGGTNDNPPGTRPTNGQKQQTASNIKAAIKTLQEKGYKVLAVPASHDSGLHETTKNAAEEAGAEVVAGLAYGTGGPQSKAHLTKTDKEKIDAKAVEMGASTKADGTLDKTKVVYSGDSNAVGASGKPNGSLPTASIGATTAKIASELAPKAPDTSSAEKPSSPAQAAADAIAAAIEAGLTAVDVKATREAHENGAKAGTVITDSSDEFGTCCTFFAEDVARVAKEIAAERAAKNADDAGKPSSIAQAAEDTQKGTFTAKTPDENKDENADSPAENTGADTGTKTGGAKTITTVEPNRHMDALPGQQAPGDAGKISGKAGTPKSTLNTISLSNLTPSNAATIGLLPLRERTNEDVKSKTAVIDKKDRRDIGIMLMGELGWKQGTRISEGKATKEDVTTSALLANVMIQRWLSNSGYRGKLKKNDTLSVVTRIASLVFDGKTGKNGKPYGAEGKATNKYSKNVEEFVNNLLNGTYEDKYGFDALNPCSTCVAFDNPKYAPGWFFNPETIATRNGKKVITDTYSGNQKAVEWKGEYQYKGDFAPGAKEEAERKGTVVMSFNQKQEQFASNPADVQNPFAPAKANTDNKTKADQKNTSGSGKSIATKNKTGVFNPITGSVGTGHYKSSQAGIGLRGRGKNNCHCGDDIYAPAGGLLAGPTVPVFAAFSGTVVSSRKSLNKKGRGYGWIVDIVADNVKVNGKPVVVRYTHIAAPKGLKVGSKVKGGQQISYVTGAGTNFGAAVTRHKGDFAAAQAEMERRGWPVTKPHLHFEVRTLATTKKGNYIQQFKAANFVNPVKVFPDMKYNPSTRKSAQFTGGTNTSASTPATAKQKEGLKTAVENIAKNFEKIKGYTSNRGPKAKEGETSKAAKGSGSSNLPTVSEGGPPDGKEAGDSPAQAAADAIAAAVEAGVGPSDIDVKATSEAHKNGAKAGTVITDSSDEFGTCCTLTAEDVAKIAKETAAKGETENAADTGKPSGPAQAAADAIAAAVEAGVGPSDIDVKATSEAHKNGAKAGTVITKANNESGSCCTLSAEDVAKIAKETAAKGETGKASGPAQAAASISPANMAKANELAAKAKEIAKTLSNKDLTSAQAEAAKATLGEIDKALVGFMDAAEKVAKGDTTGAEAASAEAEKAYARALGKEVPSDEKADTEAPGGKVGGTVGKALSKIGGLVPAGLKDFLGKMTRPFSKLGDKLRDLFGKDKTPTDNENRKDIEATSTPPTSFFDMDSDKWFGTSVAHAASSDAQESESKKGLFGFVGGLFGSSNAEEEQPNAETPANFFPSDIGLAETNLEHADENRKKRPEATADTEGYIVFVDVTIDQDLHTADLSISSIYVDDTEAQEAEYDADAFHDEELVSNQPPLILNESNEIIYSDGTYAPVMEDGVLLEQSSDTTYSYSVEYLKSGVPVAAETNIDALPGNFFTKFMGGIFTDKSIFEYSEVKSVTREYIDPDVSTPSDEYYKYIIALTDDSIRETTVPEFTSLFFLKERLAKIGYDGDVLLLIARAEEIVTKSNAVSSIITTLGRPISAIKSFFILSKDTPETTTDLNTLLPTNDGIMQINDIRAVTIYFDIEADCPNEPGLDLAYLQEIIIAKEAFDDATEDLALRSMRCGSGDKDTYVKEVALYLENGLDFAKIDRERLYNIIRFAYLNDLNRDQATVGTNTSIEKTPNREQSTLPDSTSTNINAAQEQIQNTLSGYNNSNPNAENQDNSSDSQHTATEPAVSNGTNTIVFEVRAVGSDGTVLIDWVSSALNISGPTQLDFRWDASDYSQCLVFIADSGGYSLTRGGPTNMTSGNTATEGYDIFERTGDYRIECAGQSNGEFGTDARVIHIEKE